jgi:hypothetical protein
MITIRRFILGLSCALSALPFPLLARWGAPPEFRVHQVSGGEFFLRNIKSQETVEVRSSKDLKLQWKVKIEDYDGLFSIFRATPDGKYLIHVRGNHMIYAINQVCVTVYGASGYRDTYKLSDFWSSLPKYEAALKTSIDPSCVWLVSIEEPSADTLDVQLDQKRFAWISIREHKVQIHE